MLAELLAGDVFGLLLIFARTGSALMLLPGFGEPFVLARGRLLLAGLLSLALAGPLAAVLPPPPADVLSLARLVGGEVVWGLFIGAGARMLLAALHIAGTIIAFQAGLAAAAIFDPHEATQGTLPGNFLTTTALVLLFVTDGHHAILTALAASYAGQPAGSPPPLGDMADFVARLADQAFGIGLRIAMPVILVSLVMQLGMGILNRLMPNLQVFFIAMPLQLLITFVAIMLSVAGGLLAFLAVFGAGLAELALAG